MLRLFFQFTKFEVEGPPDKGIDAKLLSLNVLCTFVGGQRQFLSNFEIVPHLPLFSADGFIHDRTMNSPSGTSS